MTNNDFRKLIVFIIKPAQSLGDTSYNTLAFEFKVNQALLPV